MEDSGSEEIRIEDVLSHPILLTERIRKAVEEADSFRFECSEVGRQVDRLSQMLRSAVRFATSTASFYDRPVRRIMAELSKNLERALTLIRKCKRQSVLRRVVTITNSTDFRRIFTLLDTSIGDMKWLLSIFDSDSSNGDGIVLTLPPIASNDPIVSWVWSFIASIQMGQLPEKIEAAGELASLAEDNDRNKKIIIEEGGAPPLLKLLKENTSSEAQIAAATALRNLANDRERVRVIVSHLGVPVIVNALSNSAMKVQIRVSNLVARMAKFDPVAQEDFARENVIRHLVSLLSMETFIEEQKKQSIHSILQISKGGRHYSSSSSSTWGAQNEKVEPEVKFQLKVSCAEALWMLARGSVGNSRRITETKGLLCLGKLIEKEDGELQMNCLMAVMEITAAAESNSELRRSAFRMNSPAAKTVVDQLLRLVNESDAPSLQIPSIRSIGSLARTFPARETRVVSPLVNQLGSRNLDVAAEAAISLGKFACPENFLCVEHSKAVIAFDGVPALMRLLRGNERTQLHGVVLLCYLALHAGNSEALEEARVLTALEGADRTLAAHHVEIKELISKAVYHLNLYHTAVLPHRPSYSN